MKLTRDLQNNRIIIWNNDKKVLEIGFEADEFVYIFYTNDQIVITKELDEIYFKELNKILDNDYFFPHEYSIKQNNLIVWFSDGYCQLDDENERNLVNRMVMRRKDNKIYLSVFNPFCEQNGLVKNFNLVAFSPSGNGFLTKNLITNTTFQDDMVSAYQKTLFSRRITK